MKHSEQKSEQFIEDVISLTRGGIGYVSLRDKEEGEARIENHLLNTALHGDYVQVLVYPKLVRGQATGEVVSVLARAKNDFVGTFHDKKGTFIVDPQDPRFYTHILIPGNERGGARDGEKVLVRISAWDEKTRIPFGSVIEILGKPGVHETEIKAILRDRGIVDEFPKAVLEEVREIERVYKELFKKEVRERKDLRHIKTFTIDPEDAKDFDDALSVEALPNGNYKIGVHIADVSFFVRKGTALDTEAARRSTSLYLVDRTIPMLPMVLSNDLCSLKPNEDRLAFSVIFEMSPLGEIKNQWFGKTIIHSVKRFTYEEAQRVLDQKQGALYEELSILRNLGRRVRSKREEAGALSFAHDEVKFILDEHGKPLRVFRKKHFETNKLIEEFMILANSAVARFMSVAHPTLKDSFIYRVHDVPDREKIQELELVMKALGYKISLKKKNISSKDIANLLKYVEGAPHQEMIHTLTIRALAKAVYTTKNIGHFGLSLKHYTHFTSPIRRYPDLIVHRMLLKSLRHEKIPLRDIKQYEAISRYATEAEIAAAETERASVKYKQAEYMAVRVGDTFDGIITGISERGIFVSEKETLAEGMVSLRDLTDDYYVFDEKRFSLVGKRTRKKYSLGDFVKIKIKRADIETRLIDYIFI